MTDKLKLWEEAWDQRATALSQQHPLKTVHHLPQIPAITRKTGRFLRIKALLYLLCKDQNRLFRRYFWKHPLRYGWNLFKSYTKNPSFVQEGDFFLYGFPSLAAFQEELPPSLFVAGFSYCHKPLECPCGRFNDQCIHDITHPVCGQCFIGKVVHSLPQERRKVFFIPTVHYIGEKFFELLQIHPADSILFLITACELTLRMFADWGNMLQIRGVGVRLGGRICNTWKAFELSEIGIKPGLTCVEQSTQTQIMEIVSRLH